MEQVSVSANKSCPELSLVIPLYNEEEALRPFSIQLLNVLADLDISSQIIMVDDGSNDRTLEVIRDLSARNPNLSGLSFSRNFGKEAAMLAGLEYAKGRAVVIMDGDGQHPPDLLSSLLAPWRAGEADIVTAQKTSRGADSLFQRLSAATFNRLMRSLTGLELEGSSDYRLMDRKVVTAVLEMKERLRFFRGMTSWVGFRKKQIPFEVKERLAGESGWTTRQLFGFAVTAVTSFTSRPLIWVMGVGAAGVGIALILLAQALISKFTGAAVSGWTSLTVLVLLFGSGNLMAIGLVGVYLARIFDEVKERPVYILQEEVGIDNSCTFNLEPEHQHDKL